MGSGNESRTDGEDTEETFHIYILSFAYGILAIVIVGHLIWRWEWRRRKLIRLKCHVPGDKSFKCKAMQLRLTDDFNTIKTISPDPRLINTNFDPKDFGHCKEGSNVPTHWYRMKAMDTAADLVSANMSLLRGRTRVTLALPEFLDQLQQQNNVDIANHQTLVDHCTQLYTLARYRDGVQKFGQAQLGEFKSLVQQLQQLLSSSETSLPQQERMLPHHDLVRVTFSQTSQEPLLSSSVDSSTSHPLSSSTPISMATTQHSSTKSKRPQEIELSPLVESESSSVTSTSVERHAGPFSPDSDVHPRSRLYSGSETPV